MDDFEHGAAWFPIEDKSASIDRSRLVQGGENSGNLPMVLGDLISDAICVTGSENGGVFDRLEVIFHWELIERISNRQ